MLSINKLFRKEMGGRNIQGCNKSMRFFIDAFPDHKKEIETLYISDRIFKEICDHYSVCAKALACWKRSRKKEAPARRIEYEELLRSLQEEIYQYLIKLYDPEYKECRG